MLKTNEKKLAQFFLQGNITLPSGYLWEIGHDAVARSLPSVGGITLNFKVGDLANGLIADHLEPGISTCAESDKGGKKNTGYNIFACIGNEATVLTGAAKGRKGTVTGKHGGVEHVMIDFDQKTLEKLTYDDKIQIKAYGCGLQLEDFEDIKTYSLSPELLKKMNPKIENGKLIVDVVTTVPAVVMGSGLGSEYSFKGDYDIQTSDPATNQQYKLDQLRLGDIVAIIDHNGTHGWSYCPGAITIGVIIHGDSYLAGHGPGCMTIMATRSDKIVPRLNDKANIGRYLNIGRYRKSK